MDDNDNKRRRHKIQENSKNDGVSATTMWMRTIVGIVLLPALSLFGSAGTFDWLMAWIYIGLSVIGFVISRFIVFRTNPDLLRERAQMMDHRDTAKFDRILSPFLALVGPTLIGLVAGFAIRFEWIPVFPPWVQWIGLVTYVLATVFGSWALIVNRFFSGVVRIQRERGHKVIKTGPYAIVRHPGYLGGTLGYLGMVFILGSPWAFIPYIFQMTVLVWRTALEDRMLQVDLPGYVEYTHQTRYRLVPGIW
jgi:protein-S-isoprenylcysteine O-methyltransferase Ste14